MDGSIADSTVLRMRTQLQRMQHATPSTQPDGFLEQLLKLPEPLPVPDRAEDASIANPSEESLPTAEAVGPREANDDTEDDAAKSEPHKENDLLPALPVCYAPITLPQPQVAEPVAETVVAADVPKAEAAVVQATVIETRPVQQSEVETATELTTSLAPPPIIAEEAANEQPDQPTQLNVASTAQDAFSKTVRDARRIKEPREKVEPKSDGPQNIVKVATTSTVQPEVSKDESVPDHPQPESSPATSRLDQSQPVSLSETKSEISDEPKQRDKWYEPGDKGAEGAQQSSLVDRIQAELSDEANSPVASDDPSHDIAGIDLPNRDAIESATALPEVPGQATVDNAMAISDASAAAQANAAQSLAGQRVIETAGVSTVDGTGRGNQAATGGVGAVGASGPLRSSGGGSASSTSSASTSDVDQPREITQQERVRLVQRVARSFSRLGPDGGQVTLKLHPPQLGVLSVSIKIEGQTMTARLQTETSAARDTIVENLSVLRDRLSEQGIEIEKFQVEVGQQEDFSSDSGQMNGFTGNDGSAQQNQSHAAGELDYRRTGRTPSSRQKMAPPLAMEPKMQGWTAADRSLDVRA